VMCTSNATWSLNGDAVIEMANSRSANSVTGTPLSAGRRRGPARALA
jgi:hypothetical protein